MSKLTGKKLILLGERDGVPSPAWRPALPAVGPRLSFRPRSALCERRQGQWT